MNSKRQRQIELVRQLNKSSRFDGSVSGIVLYNIVVYIIKLFREILVNKLKKHHLISACAVFILGSWLSLAQAHCTSCGNSEVKDAFRLFKEYESDFRVIDLSTSSTSRATDWLNLHTYINQNKPIFDKHPTVDDIVQDSSLDCGFLASLATVVERNGYAAIEKIMYDDVSTGHVYVQFNHPTKGGVVIIKMRKERDTSGASLWSSRFTTGSKLWVHLLERAYEAFQMNVLSGDSFPVRPTVPFYKPTQTVFPTQVLSALVSKKVSPLSDTGGYNTGGYTGGFLVFNYPFPPSEKKLSCIFETEDAVLISRHGHGADTGTPLMGMHRQHYFAVTSGVVTDSKQQKGIWIFNTLNRSNGSVIGTMLSFLGLSNLGWSYGDYSRKFFLPLKTLHESVQKDNISFIISSSTAQKCQLPL
ncbi:MAG: hypothetical protein HQK53_04925 [Oligoflexia bacterium]|nr:hypothetical protein [Oligoflexia bacterium]